MGKKSRLKAERANAALLTPEQPPPPAWASKVVVFLGIGFILTSLLQMGVLSDSGHYRQIFQDNPEGYVQFRFLVSWSSRWLGLAFGIGLLFRKEFFRKALIVLASGTIAVVYWKHPYAGVVRHLQYSSELMTANGVPFSPESVIQYLQASNLSWATLSWFAQVLVAVFIVSDICFALVVIFFLTRPSVKSLFR